MRNVWLPSVGSQPGPPGHTGPFVQPTNAAAVATTRNVLLILSKTLIPHLLFIISAYRIVIYFPPAFFLRSIFRIAPVNPAVIEIISLAQLPPVLVRNRNILRGTRNDQSFGYGGVPSVPDTSLACGEPQRVHGRLLLPSTPSPEALIAASTLYEPVVVYPLIQACPPTAP